MIGESVAIVAVLLVTCFMGVRAGKKKLAQLTLPFLCVPACVLIGEVLYASFSARFALRFSTVRLTSTVIGVILGSAFCVLAANLILPQKARFAFTVGCLLFVALLAFAYILPLLA